jgi:hypothetical protein
MALGLTTEEMQNIVTHTVTEVASNPDISDENRTSLWVLLTCVRLLQANNARIEEQLRSLGVLPPGG